MINVGICGYGVIGRRVADAAAAQPDMRVVGVVKKKPDYKARVAVSKGYEIYAVDAEGQGEFSQAGIDTSGVMRDLLDKSDVIIDASPEDMGAKNKAIYENAGKKAIYQGGEDAGVADMSFVAQCNFEKALGKNSLRVVSCNTTGLCRLLNALDGAFGVEKARAVIVRRAADPDESSKGPIDSVVLDPVHIPSHHGLDVNTVLPHIKIITMAVKIPTTHMHVHSLIVSLKDRAVTADRVVDLLGNTTRLLLLSSKSGFKSTANVFDYARELGRPRSDLYEAAVWSDSVSMIDGELYLYMGIGQEAIVVPENVDAVRALSGGYSKEESISLTNRSLRIVK